MATFLMCDGEPDQLMASRSSIVMSSTTKAVACSPLDRSATPPRLGGRLRRSRRAGRRPSHLVRDLSQEGGGARSPVPADGLDRRPSGDARGIEIQSSREEPNLAGQLFCRPARGDGGLHPVGKVLGKVVGRLTDEWLGIDRQPPAIRRAEHVERIEVAVNDDESLLAVEK